MKIRQHFLAIAAGTAGVLLSSAPASAQTLHPLDPLSADEIERSVAVVNADERLGAAVRFAAIELAEPQKNEARDDIGSPSPRRAARLLAYDWASRTLSDIVVDLDDDSIRAWTDMPGSEPPIRRLITERVTEVALADRRFRDEMAQAGVADLSRVRVLASVDEDTPLATRGEDRIVRGNAYMLDERVEAMGAPVSVLVNLTEGRLLDVTRQPGQWRPSDRSGPDRGRPPLTPLEIEQPAGPGFEIDGHAIRWQNWLVHYGVHPRRGLELYDIRYTDDGDERSILYRAAVSETLTPYGDPDWAVWYPLDEGDYGLGSYGIRSAVPGGDAPPNAVFRSAVLHDHRGAAYEVPRAVTVYERDAGVLWRHANESRRARELVLAFYSTIDNYDYAFNWIFRQDGRLEVEVQLTGVINYGRTAQARDAPFSPDTRRYRSIVAPGITGPIHQHFFSYRLDFDVDGTANSVIEAETERDPIGLANPDGHWFASRERVLESESVARRSVDPAAGRTWRVINEDRLNRLGQPTGYALVPGGNVAPAPAPVAPSRRKMRFVDHHLWVTAFAPDEVYAGGELLQPGVRGGGLPEWTEANRPLRNADLVLWYTLGITHVVRPEDYPLMPTHTAAFNLIPFGFFDENPALDVEPPDASLD